MELAKRGKQQWIIPREDAVEAKGKGKLTTFWLNITSGNSVRTVSTERSDDTMGDCGEADDTPTADATGAKKDIRKSNRLAHWNCTLLTVLLQRVVSARKETSRHSVKGEDLTAFAQSIGQGMTSVDEVVDALSGPGFLHDQNVEGVELDCGVISQLRAYVSKIVSMYNDNPCTSAENFLKCIVP
jgi:hypothetical protein